MILILMKGKLNHTDIFLPILAGLRKNNLKKKIKIIYPSKESLDYLKKNTSLYKSLKSVSRIGHFYSTEELQKYYLPYLIAGIVSVIHRNLILIKLFFTRVYVLNIEIPPRISWLINLNRKLYKGKKVSLFLYTFGIDQLQATFKRVQQLKGIKHNEFLNKLDTDSDLLISSFKSSEIKTIYSDIDKHSYDICYVGKNLYKWSSWQELIINNSQDDISNLPDDYIFFPLAILIRKDDNNVKDFRGSIRKILEAIREEDKKIYIIFRPHPTTEISELDILLKDMHLENYIISYANPIVLIKYCKFVVRYGTSLMDSRVFDQGKFLIRYFYPELAIDMKEEINYNKNLYGKDNFIDITDEQVLKTTIQETLKDREYKTTSKNLVNDEKDSVYEIIKYFNFKKKFIYVFLNNKIISCDTIVPLMLEIKSNNKNIDIIFWIFDFNTYNFIKKNELLYNAINEIGSLVCLSREKNKVYFDNKGISKYSFKRLNILINFLRHFLKFIVLAKNVFLDESIFIHFKALNLWPAKILYYLNSKNTILCDADSSGWTLSAYEADKFVHKNRPDPYKFSGFPP